MGYSFEPTVVCSLDGRRPVALIAFQGMHGIQNRDAVGFYFKVRAPVFSEDSRIAVLFSGTSMMSTPEYFGLPDFKDRDANFVQFALAAVGDHLDAAGFPPFTPSGVGAAQIEAFSGQFQEWKRREAAPDDVVLGFVRARLYWTWRYNFPRTLFTSHDLLRLGREMADLHRLALLEEGRLWTTHSKSAFGIALEPKPELLREQKLLLDSPQSPSARADTIPEATPATPRSVPKSARPPKKKPKRRKGTGSDSTAFVFVDEARLADLRKLTPPNFDLLKLISLCEELNVCYRSQCYFAVAALTRALLDHVPPIFGLDSFAKVANNYGQGGKSFSESMQHLENSARRIADAHLHLRIRKKESLPSRTQVNFAADVDVLLSEVVRILS